MVYRYCLFFISCIFVLMWGNTGDGEISNGKTMLKISSIIIILSFILVTNTSAWDLGKEGRFQFEQVNDNVYVMHGPREEPNPDNHGFMNNPAIIVAEHGLIVIDPGSAYPVGLEVLKEIEKISTKPVLAVFNTHVHGDHWLANQAIKEKYPQVRIYGHPAMIEQANGDTGLYWIDMMERLTDGKTRGTRVVAAEMAVTNSQTIEVDGQIFKIHSLVPAHTNTDIMIEHVNSKTLFTGDNSFNQRMGRFDETASMMGNIKALEYALGLDIKTYVPGHGQSGSSDAAVKPFLNYLKRVQEVVEAGFEEELQDFEIKDRVIAQFEDYSSWAGFDVNFGKHINSMYLEVEKAAW